MALRVIFMGTPAFSAEALKAIVAAGHDVVAVYSQPPRPAGRRGLEMKKSPVHDLAESHGIEVRTPISLKSEAEQEAFRALDGDVAIVVAYGLLLPAAILNGTRLGAWNGHASLLPRWRGAAPIQRAIIEGDVETGMMIMRMDEGLDTGPIALTEKVAIGPDMTAGELHDVLSDLGARLTVETLARLESDALPTTPQAEEGVTYAAKISKSETRIDWAEPAERVHNRIRGLAPYPGAWCEPVIGGRPERLKLLRSTVGPGEGPPGTIVDGQLTIACGEGAVRLVEVQRAGGKLMEARSFLRGAGLKKGDRL